MRSDGHIVQHPYWSTWPSAPAPATASTAQAKCGVSLPPYIALNNQSMLIIWPSVKIDQEGLVSGTQNSGIWAGDSILETLVWTSTIPASLAPGNYLIRHELIAVHQANNPQCE